MNLSNKFIVDIVNDPRWSGASLRRKQNLLKEFEVNWPTMADQFGKEADKAYQDIHNSLSRIIYSEQEAINRSSDTGNIVSEVIGGVQDVGRQFTDVRSSVGAAESLTKAREAAAQAASTYQTSPTKSTLSEVNQAQANVAAAQAQYEQSRQTYEESLAKAEEREGELLSKYPQRLDWIRREQEFREAGATWPALNTFLEQSLGDKASYAISGLAKQVSNIAAILAGGAAGGAAGGKVGAAAGGVVGGPAGAAAGGAIGALGGSLGGATLATSKLVEYQNTDEFLREIYAKSDDELLASPVGQSLIDQGIVDPGEIRQEIILKGIGDVAKRGEVIGAAEGLVIGGLIHTAGKRIPVVGQAAGAAASRGLGRQVAAAILNSPITRTAAAGATEEFISEGLEAINVNLGLQEALGEGNVTEGALEQALTGAAMGGFLGGAGSAVQTVRGSRANRPQATIIPSGYITAGESPATEARIVPDIPPQLPGFRELPAPEAPRQLTGFQELPTPEETLALSAPGPRPELTGLRGLPAPEETVTSGTRAAIEEAGGLAPPPEGIAPAPEGPAAAPEEPVTYKGPIINIAQEESRGQTVGPVVPETTAGPVTEDSRGSESVEATADILAESPFPSTAEEAEGIDTGFEVTGIRAEGEIQTLRSAESLSVPFETADVTIGAGFAAEPVAAGLGRVTSGDTETNLAERSAGPWTVREDSGEADGAGPVQSEEERRQLSEWEAVRRSRDNLLALLGMTNLEQTPETSQVPSLDSTLKSPITEAKKAETTKAIIKDVDVIDDLGGAARNLPEKTKDALFGAGGLNQTVIEQFNAIWRGFTPTEDSTQMRSYQSRGIEVALADAMTSIANPSGVDPWANSIPESAPAKQALRATLRNILSNGVVVSENKLEDNFTTRPKGLNTKGRPNDIIPRHSDVVRWMVDKALLKKNTSALFADKRTGDTYLLSRNKKGEVSGDPVNAVLGREFDGLSNSSNLTPVWLSREDKSEIKLESGRGTRGQTVHLTSGIEGRYGAAPFSGDIFFVNGTSSALSTKEEVTQAKAGQTRDIGSTVEKARAGEIDAQVTMDLASNPDTADLINAQLGDTVSDAVIAQALESLLTNPNTPTVSEMGLYDASVMPSLFVAQEEFRVPGAEIAAETGAAIEETAEQLQTSINDILKETAGEAPANPYEGLDIPAETPKAEEYSDLAQQVLAAAPAEPAAAPQGPAAAPTGPAAASGPTVTLGAQGGPGVPGGPGGPTTPGGVVVPGGPAGPGGPVGSAPRFAPQTYGPSKDPVRLLSNWRSWGENIAAAAYNKAHHFFGWLREVSPVIGTEQENNIVWQTYTLMPNKILEASKQLNEAAFVPAAKTLIKFGKKYNVPLEKMMADIAGNIHVAMHVVEEGHTAFRQGLATELQEAINNAEAAGADPATDPMVLGLQQNLKDYDDVQTGKRKWKGMGDVALPGGATLEYFENYLKDMEKTFSRADMEEMTQALADAFQAVTEARVKAGVLPQAIKDQWYPFKIYAPTATYIESSSLSSDDAGNRIFNPTRYYHRGGAHHIAAPSTQNLLQYMSRASTEIGGREFRDALDALHKRISPNNSYGLVRERSGSLASKAGQNTFYKKVYERPGFVRYELEYDNIGNPIMVGYKYTFAENKLDLRKRFPGLSEEEFNTIFLENDSYYEVVAKSWAGPAQAGKVWQTLRPATAATASLWTKFVPLFAPKTAVRDIPERITNMLGRGVLKSDGTELSGAAVSRKMMALLFNPTFISAYTNSFTGRNKNIPQDLLNKYEKYWREFEKSGVNLTILSQLKVRSKTTPEQRAFDYTELGKTLGLPNHLIDEWNDFFNSFAPFLQYVSMREQDVNTGDAEFKTLEMFNLTERGGLAPYASAIYPFFVSSMQGSKTVLRSLGLTKDWRSPNKNVRNARWTAVGLTLGSLALIAFLREWAGDDEETGVNRFDAIPFNSASRYIPVSLGKGKGFFKAPIGFGMHQMTWGAGLSLDRLSRGLIAPGDAFANIFISLTRSLLPENFPQYSFASDPVRWLMQTLSPTVTQPVMEWAMNKNTFGQPITAGRTGLKSASASGRIGTPDAWHEMAKTIRDKTGIDFYPETLRHFANGYLPGPLAGITGAIEANSFNKNTMFQSTRDEIGPWLSALGAAGWYGAEINIAQTEYFDVKSQLEKMIIDRDVSVSDTSYGSNRAKRDVYITENMQKGGFTPAQIEQYILLRNAESDLNKINQSFKADAKILRTKVDAYDKLRGRADEWSRDRVAVQNEVIRKIQKIRTRPI